MITLGKGGALRGGLSRALDAACCGVGAEGLVVVVVVDVVLGMSNTASE